jgi:hypothetical protein
MTDSWSLSSGDGPGEPGKQGSATGSAFSFRCGSAALVYAAFYGTELAVVLPPAEPAAYGRLVEAVDGRLACRHSARQKIRALCSVTVTN